MKLTLFPLLLAAVPLVWGAGTRPPEIESLVDRARAAPAEFAADALLRIAGSPKVEDRDWKYELLEEAYRRAAGAQQPFKRRALGLPPRGTPVDVLNRAFSLDMDACSLRCRAVRAMLPLDARRARQWFTDIPRPRLAPLTCEDALVYDLSIYYETLGEVVAQSFSAGEIAEEEPFKLLESYARTLESPVQVAPVARLLASAKLNRPQMERLVAGFSAALKELSGDDRAFAASVGQKGRIGSQIAALAEACKKQEIGAAGLVDAYRAFLVRHLKAERCADSDDAPPAAASFGMAVSVEPEPGVVQFFNNVLRADPVRPIMQDEIQPAKVTGAAGGLRSCESPECQDLAKRYTALIIGPNGFPYSNEQKAAQEWQARLKEYLVALAGWKQDSVVEAGGHFQQKCSFYSDLFNIVPNGPSRELVTIHFLDFLKQNSYQRENRIEWFLPVASLIGRVFLDPLAMKDLMRDLRNSADPVVALYAELEALVPRSPGVTLSLL